MGGHTLVEIQDLVGLGTAGRPVTCQMLKAAPLALVCCDKRIQIHATHCIRGHPRLQELARYAEAVMDTSTSSTT